MITDKELFEFSSYHKARILIMDFATIKRIAESDIRDILKAKKTDISITPMWVDFCSCGTAVEVDKPFSEIWDIHNFADICKEIGV